MITKEDFETWRSSEATETVLRMAAETAMRCRELWEGLLDADPDPEFLKDLDVQFLDLRAKVSAYEQLANIKYEDLIDDDDEQGGDQTA